MTLYIASTAGPVFQAEHQDVFLDGYHVGVLDYLRTYQSVPVTTLDIDRFISTTISNPVYPRAWNAGYLAGWLAGLVSGKGPRFLALAQAQHTARSAAHLHLLEGTARRPPPQQPSCQKDTGTVTLVIPMEDPLVHTAAHPFCDDPKCLCHEEQAFIAPVYEQYQEGLLTEQEATNIVNGKTV